MPGRAAVAVAAISTFALLLTGCTASSAPKSGPVTITVQDVVDQKAEMKVIVPAFEKANPNIKVKIQTISNDQKATTNAQVITGSNPPDVAFVPIGSTPYITALKVNALVPLTDVWANQKLDTRYPASTAAFAKASNGTPYVVATDNILYDIAFYNKDLFAKAGITAPADNRIPSNAALYSMAAKLKAIGVGPLGVNGKDVFSAGWMADALFPTAATPAQLHNYSTSFAPKVKVTEKYTDAPFVKVLQQLSDWQTHGVFQDGFLAQDLTTTQAQFEQSRTGMFLGANVSVSALLKGSVKFGWLLLPPVEGSSTKVQMPSYQGDSWGIPKNSKNVAAAKKFLEFLVSNEMQVKAFGDNGVFPIVNTVPVSELTGVDPITLQLIGDSNKNGAPTGWTSAVPGPDGQLVIGTSMQSAWSGQSTVQQAAQAQQAALVKARAGN